MDKTDKVDKTQKEKPKPYSDRRWHENPGGIVTGHREISKEEREASRQRMMKIYKIDFPPIE